MFTPNKPLRKRYRGINLTCNEEKEILNVKTSVYDSNLKSASTAADENTGSDGSQEFKAVNKFDEKAKAATQIDQLKALNNEPIEQI